MKAPKTFFSNSLPLIAKASSEDALSLSPLKCGKEMLSLLSKARKETLTESERERLQTYQQDLVKIIPLLLLFVLPGSFLTLPLLFMVVPKERLMPRSLFQ